VPVGNRLELFGRDTRHETRPGSPLPRT